MTDREWITKTALIIKRVIGRADYFNSEPNDTVCILPKDDRRDLGECLDRLGELD